MEKGGMGVMERWSEGNEKRIVKKQEERKDSSKEQHTSICTNKDCKLRKAGCKGFEACPGYKGR